MQKVKNPLLIPFPSKPTLPQPPWFMPTPAHWRGGKIMHTCHDTASQCLLRPLRILENIWLQKTLFCVHKARHRFETLWISDIPSGICLLLKRRFQRIYPLLNLRFHSFSPRQNPPPHLCGQPAKKLHCCKFIFLSVFGFCLFTWHSLGPSTLLARVAKKVALLLIRVLVFVDFLSSLDTLLVPKALRTWGEGCKENCTAANLWFPFTHRGLIKTKELLSKVVHPNSQLLQTFPNFQLSQTFPPHF